MCRVGMDSAKSRLKRRRSFLGPRECSFPHPLLAGNYPPCKWSGKRPLPLERSFQAWPEGRSPALRMTGTHPWRMGSGWLSRVSLRSCQGLRDRMTPVRLAFGMSQLRMRSARTLRTGSHSSQGMPPCSSIVLQAGTSLGDRPRLTSRPG